MNFTKNSHKPTFICDVKPNHYNQQFSVGDYISVSTIDRFPNLSGKIIKKYTNSCLLDIRLSNLEPKYKEKLNDKIVIPYQEIDGVLLYQ